MSIENTKGGGLLLLGSRILNAVRFKLSGEASVQSSVVLCVRRPSWVGEATKEMGQRN